MASSAQQVAYVPLAEAVEFARLETTSHLDRQRRAALGQYMTAAPVAELMASMMRGPWEAVSVLDPGAGVGSLTAAFVRDVCSRTPRPREITATLIEVDPALVGHLEKTAALCNDYCRSRGVAFHAQILNEDFIAREFEKSRNKLFGAQAESFDCVIANPPYRKIRGDSAERMKLRALGIETSNLYTAFVLIAKRLLRSEGELCVIAPRSFCNGPYFRRFRRELLDDVAVDRIHLFDSRTAAFSDDDVLQENIILHGVRTSRPPQHVCITSSDSPDDPAMKVRRCPFSEVVAPNDPDLVIHLVPDELGAAVAARVRRFDHTLAELGVDVSTGPVVAFRVREHLSGSLAGDTAPLLQPADVRFAALAWGSGASRKPLAIAVNSDTSRLLVPSERYVLVKRFTSKEEARRLVAAVHEPGDTPGDRVGFENHLNYFHRKGRGLPTALAWGLMAYLNSTLVDSYFRLFNGHTQVNASDLRRLPYPSPAQLDWLGTAAAKSARTQDETDDLVEEMLSHMAAKRDRFSPVRAKKRIDQATRVLAELGLPRAQQNERSALTLLALLDLRPATPWAEAASPRRGITEMMGFMEEHYGKTYAPNTRETVRRQTMHQFVQAGLAVINPDDPARPTNSPDTVYQVEPGALGVLKAHGAPEWQERLESHLASLETLREQYSQTREMARVPVNLPAGGPIELSPGGQNTLIKGVIEEFCPRFTPGARILYVGDAESKLGFLDEEGMAALGVELAEHGKMPDVIAHVPERNWLVVVEAVTSHGPVDPKRRIELAELLSGCSAGIVYVTAFPDRRTMARHLSSISWETDVWVADSPDHMVHFNGERFLGPYG